MNKHIKRLFVTSRTMAGKVFTIAAVKDTKKSRVLAGMTVLHDDDVADDAKAAKEALRRAVEAPFYVTDYGTMKVKDKRVLDYIHEDIIETFYDVLQEILLDGLKAEGYFGTHESVLVPVKDISVVIGDASAETVKVETEATSKVTVKEEACSKEK